MPTQLRLHTICVFVLLCVVQIARGQNFDLSWYDLDAGATTSTGGIFELTGTAGQADASAPQALAGGDYTLSGGFWVAAVPVCTTFAAPDFNHDCSVDAADMAVFLACVSGPAVPYYPSGLPSGCTLAPDAGGKSAADFDGDGDVDQSDFSIVQRCYSGTGQRADPN